MITRRNFIKQSIAAGVACSIPYHLFAQEKPVQKMIWANLLHLSYQIGRDHIPLDLSAQDCDSCTCADASAWARVYRPYHTFDETVWDVILKDMAVAGINMVVIDVLNAVAYESHPEIATRNAWTPEKLRNELVKMRKLGLEPIPKLNFSTTHDAWLGEYHRMVSTKKYYEVCSDLIHEVINIFDTPRFFHLGLDEENAYKQRNTDISVVRNNNLWWSDLYFYIAEIEKKNVRPWIWSDYCLEHPETFFRKMPKSVLQSNWYYGSSFNPEKVKAVELFHQLEAHGYDQIPTGSNYYNDKNMEATVEYCKNMIDQSRLLGFMQSSWRPTMASCLKEHQEAIKQMSHAIKKFNNP